MHDRLKDEALREAGAALTKALRALQDVEAQDLAETRRCDSRIASCRPVARWRPLL